MVAARDKILAVGVAVITEPAHSFADRSIGTTDIFLITDVGKSTFIKGFIEMVMLMKRTVFLDFLRDGGRVFF
ncbi:hypothetical protein [Diplocloster hominis]|uniref:hypothetical protein n=1 Tax=Diplocloster hominis TaxID=3079010 RepID=UPI0031BAE332